MNEKLFCGRCGEVYPKPTYEGDGKLWKHLGPLMGLGHYCDGLFNHAIATCPVCEQMPGLEYIDDLFSYFCNGWQGNSHAHIQTGWLKQDEAQVEWNNLVVEYNERHPASSQDFDLCLWRAAVLDRTVRERVKREREIVESKDSPIPMILTCPNCSKPHVDKGEWETKPHKTHLCEFCEHKWQPDYRYTVGVTTEVYMQGRRSAAGGSGK